MLAARSRSSVVLAVAVSVVVLLAQAAGAGASVSPPLVDSADCTQHQLARNDDGSTGSVALPFTVNFFGRSYDHLWVNNNGNVTFDGPLVTYTPFGLVGTSAVIIAPFFADVDTRAAGSDLVSYGYGETTYDGHAAFCVDWVNVGYYNQHTDKLNSFQLLLVQREDALPGDFDIVFNYGTITWETGDASGGVNGFGGVPAYVGYSNGDGTVANSFELTGSGHPGAFLDTNTATGLIYRSINSTLPGRLVFPVRNGEPPPNRYVAMGDSYQSGVGAGDYDPNTNIGGVNECLRSQNAYAHLLVNEGIAPFTLDFVACSGARIETLYQSGPVTTGPPWNEDAQIDHVNERTALVTVGIGGNNLDFGPLIADCVLKHFIFSSCEDAYDEQITNALIALYDHPNGLNVLQQLYSEIRFRAWRGRELVLGYPRFFPLEGGSDWWSSGLLVPRCQNIRVSDQLWINYKISQLDTLIRVSAETMGVPYVDIYNASAGHELCAGDPGFLNGIDLGNRVQSFHPSAYGQSIIAGYIAGAIASGPRLAARRLAAAQDDTFIVHPGETVTTTKTVDGGAQASFSTTWPGSTVQMTLRSPSGRVIDAGTTAADVYHRAGPRQELYVVNDPEPGTWTVELYGANVQPAGEPTTLAFFEAPTPNADPVARFTSTLVGRTVHLDATASSDSDGHVVKYLWEFGDGTFGVGPTTTHTYTDPGTYRVTLVVADDQGALGFAAGETDLLIPRYEFTGFFPPVDNQALNDANAGSTIPVKFTIGLATVPDIIETGFPQSQQIDCVTRMPLPGSTPAATEGAWEVRDPVTGEFHYNWKTGKAWAGTCRRLTVGLDDGSRHAADFAFH